MSKRAQIALTVACCIVGLIPSALDMAGVETSGILTPYMPVIMSVLRVLSPFALIACGALIGWMAHKAIGENERLEAEHAEKMRRDREEYEENKAREIAERKAAEQANMKKEKMIDDFRKADPFTKKHVMDIYSNGTKKMTESDFRYSNMFEWADYESRYYDVQGNMVLEVRLFDETRKMLDDNPELLK